LLIAGYVQLIRRAMPANRALAIGCAGFLAAMLMHGLVDHSFFLIELAYPFMLTAGVLVSVTTTDSSTTTSTSISTSSSTI
jgi:hypothetical protein